MVSNYFTLADLECEPVLDREGCIQLLDVRRDFHIGLDPELGVEAIESASR